MARRKFVAKPEKGKRLHLNFEAVDYRCEAFVNGQSIGKHVGGNAAFSFDITDSIEDGNNEIVVRVEDDTEKFQLRGKQTLNARGIWYTQVSGILQTVWLESVNDTHFGGLKITTDATTGSIAVKPQIVGNAHTVRIVVSDGDKVAATISGTADEFKLRIPGAKL